MSSIVEMMMMPIRVMMRIFLLVRGAAVMRLRFRFGSWSIATTVLLMLISGCWSDDSLLGNNFYRIIIKVGDVIIDLVV